MTDIHEIRRQVAHNERASAELDRTLANCARKLAVIEEFIAKRDADAAEAAAKAARKRWWQR